MAWLRLGVYIRIAWRDLLVKVRSGSLVLPSALDIMEARFGTQGKIWTLQDLQINFPPVPPQPP